MCEKCDEIKQLVQSWIDQQGHERCWYYPEIFKQLVNILEVKQVVESNLPPRSEFEAGCKRYQEEEYDEIK